MANSTVGQLAPFIAAAAVPTPFKTSGGDYAGRGGARFTFGFFGAFNGTSSVSGHTKVSGVATGRRVLLFTQSPTYFLREVTSSWVDGSFSFTGLASGTYLVLDIGPDNTTQALVYDWIAA